MASDRSENKTELVRRLHCAEGHLRGIRAMIESGADCRSVVHQIRAVQGALREVNGLIVTRHLTTCLSELLANTDQDPATREYYLAEVMSLYELFGASRLPSNLSEEIYEKQPSQASNRLRNCRRLRCSST